MGALELAQQLDHRGALDHVLGTIAGEPLQGTAEAHDRHGGIVPARAPCEAGQGPRSNAAMTSAKRATDSAPVRVAEADDRGLHAGLGELPVAADVLLGRRRAAALARLVRADHARRRRGA